MTIEGLSKQNRVCRIWVNVLDRKDGSYIIRYKVYETCLNLTITAKYKNQHVADSPYSIRHIIYPESCECPRGNLAQMLISWNCRAPKQLHSDLSRFDKVNWTTIRNKVPVLTMF